MFSKLKFFSKLPINNLGADDAALRDPGRGCTKVERSRLEGTTGRHVYSQSVHRKGNIMECNQESRPQATPFHKLQSLKAIIETKVPPDASPEKVWASLGWQAEFAEPYRQLRKQGIDVRPLVSQTYYDIVSIVDEGVLCFPYGPHQFTWDRILDGRVEQFQGASPKERLLSVIESSLVNCGN